MIQAPLGEKRGHLGDIGQRRVQFRHFDHERRRLTIFTKGSKVRTVPIVEAAFWHDLGRHR